MHSPVPVLRFVTGLFLMAAWISNPQASAAQAVCPLDSLKPRQVKSLETLKHIPILNQGRIKPFESFAKNFLLLVSGRERCQKEVPWNGWHGFAPRTTYDDKIFLINNPEIPEAPKIALEKAPIQLPPVGVRVRKAQGTGQCHQRHR